MGSILLSGAIAGVIAKATKNVAYPITLHSRAAGADASGNMLASFTDYPLSGFVDTNVDARRYSEEVPARAVRALLLQSGAGAAPKLGDEFTANGKRYHVLRVAADPAAATWDLLAAEA